MTMASIRKNLHGVSSGGRCCDAVIVNEHSIEKITRLRRVARGDVIPGLFAPSIIEDSLRKVSPQYDPESF